MVMSQMKSAGYFRNGMPYNRLGHGPRPLIVFQGLTFENKPQSGLGAGLANWMYKFLEDDYTVYSVLRKREMPRGYTLQDMADDYAVMIREEFGGPLDVIGISTGGSIVQHFAADHPDLVRRLVIHSSAYVLSDTAKQLQLMLGQLAQRHQWTKAWAILMKAVLPRRGVKQLLSRPIVWLSAPLMALTAPQDPNDLIVTVEAEDVHNFKDRLAQITAPTLIVAGEQDPFYTPTLFRETAAGIPNARLCLYPGMGHPASGKQFKQDVLAFLRESA
jgi:pimeloyl-ACP methyl ester carboxylesterase